ncbi:zinc metalloprotease HtpX [Longibacter sp.]|uniref:zinc metalloprotease HtpX n=1 Tax=Longibacter sp. TaxID=2045415 RepID=UPI003EB7F59A
MATSPDRFLLSIEQTLDRFSMPMNTLKVGVLLTVLTLCFVAIGGWLGGTGGMIVALGLAVAMNVGSYWFSDRIVLRMTGAEPLDPRQAPDLHAMTRRLARNAGIPVPALYLIRDPQPNAFATGRNPERGVVAVNQGLLDLLSPQEIEAVIAHEIAHIKHRDTLTMTITASLAGAIMTLINMAQWSTIFSPSDEDAPGLLPLLVAGLVTPIAAAVVQMAVSRAREYEADRRAVDLTGSPAGLIGALERLEFAAQRVPSRSMRQETAHLCIVNPLTGGQRFTRLFSTHPPMNERIAALRARAPHGATGRRVSVA